MPTSELHTIVIFNLRTKKKCKFSSRYVEAEPSWAKQLEGEMTLGRKRVTFRFLPLLFLIPPLLPLFHILPLLLLILPIIMEGMGTSGSSPTPSFLTTLVNHLLHPSTLLFLWLQRPTMTFTLSYSPCPGQVVQWPTSPLPAHSTSTSRWVAKNGKRQIWANSIQHPHQGDKECKMTQGHLILFNLHIQERKNEKM